MPCRKRNRYSDSPPTPLLLIAIALVVAMAYSAQPAFSAFYQDVERAQVNSLLDRLQIAVTAHSESRLAAGDLPEACNPFTLLHPPPVNYVGVQSESSLDALPRGCWCFIDEYNWIVYNPLHAIYNGIQCGDSRLIIYVISPVQGQPGQSGIRLVQPPRFSYAWK